jgi:hypothetical protein
MFSGWSFLAVVLAAGIAGEHGLVNIKKETSHVLRIEYVETVRMPYVETPPWVLRPVELPRCVYVVSALTSSGSLVPSGVSVSL